MVYIWEGWVIYYIFINFQMLLSSLEEYWFWIRKKKHNYNNQNNEAENIIAREEPKEEKPQPPWMTFSLIWGKSLFLQLYILKSFLYQSGDHGGFWRPKVIQPQCRMAEINGFVSRYESGRGSWCGVGGQWWLNMELGQHAQWLMFFSLEPIGTILWRRTTLMYESNSSPKLNFLLYKLTTQPPSQEAYNDVAEVWKSHWSAASIVK